MSILGNTVRSNGSYDVVEILEKGQSGSLEIVGYQVFGPTGALSAVGSCADTVQHFESLVREAPTLEEASEDSASPQIMRSPF